MSSRSRTLMLAGIFPSRSSLRPAVTVTVSRIVAGSNDSMCRGERLLFDGEPEARTRAGLPRASLFFFKATVGAER